MTDNNINQMLGIPLFSLKNIAWKIIDISNHIKMYNDDVQILPRIIYSKKL